MGASSVGKNDVDAEAAGFRLGPRLNAAGRMGHAKDALELLLTEDDARAAELAALTTEDEALGALKAIAQSLVEELAIGGADRASDASGSGKYLTFDEWRDSVGGATAAATAGAGAGAGAEAGAGAGSAAAKTDTPEEVFGVSLLGKAGTWRLFRRGGGVGTNCRCIGIGCGGSKAHSG